MMLMDVYKNNSVPYMVIIQDKTKRNDFKQQLINLGYNCEDWNESYPGVLVNVDLKNFALISKACKHKCVDNRNYTKEEFKQEILCV